MSADPILVHTFRDERTLACPLCDYTLDVPPVPVSDAIGDALGMSGQTLAMVHAEQIAKRAAGSMRDHLATHDPTDWLPRILNRQSLHPAESISLTAALGPIKRNEVPGERTALMCCLALARLLGLHDWTDQ